MTVTLTEDEVIQIADHGIREGWSLHATFCRAIADGHGLSDRRLRRAWVGLGGPFRGQGKGFDPGAQAT